MHQTTAETREHPGQEQHASPVAAEAGHQRSLQGLAQRVLMSAALAFSAYQLVVAAFSPLSSLVMRSLHVGFLLLMIFWVFPAWQSKRWLHQIPWFDWALGALAFTLGLYHWLFEADLIQRSGDPTTLDLVVGATTVALLFEAARRSLGVALPLVCALFLAYGMLASIYPKPSALVAMDSTRSSVSFTSVPRASTAFPPWCQRPIFFCSFCLARSWNMPE